MSEKHANFIEKPVSLIDILDYVLKKYSQIKIAEIAEDKLIQYNEISRTIERLKESGVGRLKKTGIAQILYLVFGLPDFPGKMAPTS